MHPLVKINVQDQWHLVQQAVAICCPCQPRVGWLVRDHIQKNIKVILEQWKICRVFTSEGLGKYVEEVGTMNTEGLFSSCPYPGRGTSWCTGWHS